jgi:hypothetical protein
MHPKVMPTARFLLLILAALVILFLGCHHAALAYVLHRKGPDPILLPPTRGGDSSQIVSVAVQGARQATPEMDCDIAGNIISLRWHGKTADISFRSQVFFANSANQSPNQIGPGMYVDPLIAIDKFRLDLAERQSKGCFRQIENDHLRRAIVENLPLPPAIAYFFQLGSYDITGYFDLTPDFRMQVISPIYPSGTQPSTKTLLGYETANYAFTREGSEGQRRLRLASAAETLISLPPVEKQTLRNELAFSKTPGYFRLLFMADETTSGRVTRAILLSAPDETKLNRAVARRGSRPDDFCTTLLIGEVNCTVFPKNFGVSPELRVRVNQKDAFVAVGGMVQDVLNLEDPEASPPPSLKVLRPFRGRLIPIKFDRSSKDILRLILLPGDQLTF